MTYYACTKPSTLKSTVPITSYFTIKKVPTASTDGVQSWQYQIGYFDGFEDPMAAKFANSHMFANFQSCINSYESKDPISKIRGAFKRTQAQMSKAFHNFINQTSQNEESRALMTSGTCASFAVLDGPSLTTGHVGDSAMFILDGNHNIQLLSPEEKDEHTLRNQKELWRIEFISKNALSKPVKDAQGHELVEERRILCRLPKTDEVSQRPITRQSARNKLQDFDEIPLRYATRSLGDIWSEVHDGKQTNIMSHHPFPATKSLDSSRDKYLVFASSDMMKMLQLNGSLRKIISTTQHLNPAAAVIEKALKEIHRNRNRTQKYLKINKEKLSLLIIDLNQLQDTDFHYEAMTCNLEEKRISKNFPSIRYTNRKILQDDTDLSNLNSVVELNEASVQIKRKRRLPEDSFYEVTDTAETESLCFSEEMPEPVKVHMATQTDGDTAINNDNSNKNENPIPEKLDMSTQTDDYNDNRSDPCPCYHEKLGYIKQLQHQNIPSSRYLFEYNGNVETLAKLGFIQEIWEQSTAMKDGEESSCLSSCPYLTIPFTLIEGLQGFKNLEVNFPKLVTARTDVIDNLGEDWQGMDPGIGRRCPERWGNMPLETCYVLTIETDEKPEPESLENTVCESSKSQPPSKKNKVLTKRRPKKSNSSHDRPESPNVIFEESGESEIEEESEETESANPEPSPEIITLSDDDDLKSPGTTEEMVSPTPINSASTSSSASSLPGIEISSDSRISTGSVKRRYEATAESTEQSPKRPRTLAEKKEIFSPILSIHPNSENSTNQPNQIFQTLQEMVYGKDGDLFVEVEHEIDFPSNSGSQPSRTIHPSESMTSQPASTKPFHKDPSTSSTASSSSSFGISSKDGVKVENRKKIALLQNVRSSRMRFNIIIPFV